MNLGDIQLFFRPVIKYNYSSTTTAIAAQWALLGITPIDSENCFFNLASCTLSGTQILAQPQLPSQNNRSRFMAYYNSFTSEKQQKLTGVKSMNNYSLGGPAQGKMGFEELSLTSPLGLAQNNGSLPQNSVSDSVSFPRAIMSKMFEYNAQFNLPEANSNLNYISNSNFAQTVTINGDCELEAPVTGTTNGSLLVQPGIVSNNVFPLIQSSVSISIYKQQQENFQHMRMKFLTSTISAYPNPVFLNLSGNQDQIVSSSNIAYFSGVFVPNQATTTAANQTVDLAQRTSYGMSIQNQNPNNYSRSVGTFPTTAQCTYFQNEQFTTQSCKLSSLSLELQDIGLLCMDNISACITLQLNLTQNVLSSYLQANNFYFPVAQLSAIPTPITQVQVQQYLDGCQLGSKADYVITDLICRLEYHHYDEQSYPIMRSLMHQAKSFDSLRMQVDNIPNSGIFTQRLSLGNSTLLKCIICFIVPNQVPIVSLGQQVGSTVSLLSGKPQDCCVNLQGCQVPPLGDLRNTYLNSYYLGYSTASLLVDGIRYNSTDCNVSNPELNAYLVSQANIQTCFPGKYLDIELREFLTNRYMFCLSVNPYLDLSQQIVDQQITLTIDLNADSRIQSSMLWNESTKSINNKFSLQTFCVVSQSLVNGTEVRIQ